MEALGENRSISLETDEISTISQALNLKYVATVDNFLTFESMDTGVFRRREVAIPLSVASAILQALKRGAQRMEDCEGWIDPQRGFAEFEIRQEGIGMFRRGNFEKLKFETRPCIHSHENDPPSVYDEVRNIIYPVIRVTSSDGTTCIEISPNSPLCTPLLPLDDDGRPARVQTLKIFLAGPTEKLELLRRSRELANSFLFELNVRHGSHYSLRSRVVGPSRPRRAVRTHDTVRFPRTRVPNNVATLFSIPSEFGIRNNYTLAYLSYYQILEYYLPIVHRRDTIERVRRILRSLDFDEEEDFSVLQIVTSVERSHGASEIDQLRTLIEKCVPESKLKEFFSLDHNGHFGKRGPISGVPAIYPTSGESLASQVAKRIYKLRNRIVHAKDDARYSESTVLLPFSHEAMQLYPDIELLRLLAIEVIVSNQ